MTNKFRCDDSTIVQIEKGKIRGYFCDDLLYFRGIPYGKAERFHLAKEVEKWDDVLDTFSYGFTCPNLQNESRGMAPLMAQRTWVKDEDCLNLNVLTKDTKGKRPVVVWIHGGAYSYGSCISNALIDGDNMVRNDDVVYVSINHRLNVLGFLDLSDYGKEYKESAMVGLQDIILALEWVNKNIEKFGGDKNNVTLMGNSGGGGKIIGLMQSPKADGLFHKAVISSGTLHYALPDNNNESKTIVDALLKELNINSIKELEVIPYDKLKVAYLTVKKSLPQGTYTGECFRSNDLYVGEPCIKGLRKENKNIPIIIDTTYGEFDTLFTKDDVLSISRKEALDLIELKFKDKAEAIIEEFKKAYPKKNINELLVLDTIFRPATIDFINEAVKSELDVYNFMLDVNFDYKGKKAAWHTADLPYLFDNITLSPIHHFGEMSQKINDDIYQNIIKLIKTGKCDLKKCEEGKMITRIYDNDEFIDKENFDVNLIEVVKTLKFKTPV